MKNKRDAIALYALPCNAATVGNEPVPTNPRFAADETSEAAATASGNLRRFAQVERAHPHNLHILHLLGCDAIHPFKKEEEKGQKKKQDSPLC